MFLSVFVLAFDHCQAWNAAPHGFLQCTGQVLQFSWHRFKILSYTRHICRSFLWPLLCSGFFTARCDTADYYDARGYFLAQMRAGRADSELALLYLGAFVLLLFCGPGKISVDNMMH